MTKFHVVDDELRSTVRTPIKYAEEIAALMEGKTIFVPGLTQERAASFYSAAKRRKRRLRTRKYTDPKTKQDGIVMWFEELAAVSETTTTVVDHVNT